jgi:uncharacterized protein YbcI
MKKTKFRLSLKGAESLNREQLKNVMGGEVVSLEEDGCIKDGQACGVFKFCCGECLATFYCGKSKPVKGLE